MAAIAIAGLVAPMGYAAQPPRAAATPLEIRVGQSDDFSRIEFHWAGGARMTQRREGQVLTLRFSRDAKPDIGMLRALPPKWVSAAEARHVGGALEIVLTLADGADVRLGNADGSDFINIFEKPAPPPAPAQVAQTAPEPVASGPARPDPTPPGGVVKVAAEADGAILKMRFDWRNPAAAAVFRRGNTIWVVFDAAAKLDVSALPIGVTQYSHVETVQGPGWSAIRIIAPDTTLFDAFSDGSSWTVILGPAEPTPRGMVRIMRDDSGGPPSLTASLSGATKTIWVDDPAVHDRFAVVTALGPNKGLPEQRDYVDLTMLASVQGLAIEPRSGDLAVASDGDLVHIGRPAGLALSPRSALQAHEQAALGAPQPAGLPGLIGADWAKTGEGGFLPRYSALLAPVSEEEDKGANGPVAARMALARFLVGEELSYEAIGVLNDVARERPSVVGDAEFRGLRGIARVMAGRYKEADADFSVGILADDPASTLWRGYIAAKEGQWPDARKAFDSGAAAMGQFSPLWKSRFARADAEAALALGDYPTCNKRIAAALGERVPPEEELASRLIQARLMEALGQRDRALGVYKAIARAPLDQLAAPATLRATQIQLDEGKITPLQAAAVFDGLRYRWRGDATELETIRLLGQLYLSQGHYREALEALRSAGQRLPDLPQAVQLQADLGAAFKALFLDGQADGLEPIQALALFYDFKELTPIGADGDLMVRKLVRRLVDVDLLPQAAELLKYQVDNRLDGVPKAQVATDLAIIYLMNRQPEQALDAINASRTTILPPALNAQRRLVTARALVGIGRLDAADEILDSDTSPEAAEIKADIAWRGRTWTSAGPKFEALLGERWKTPAALSGDEEGRLLRAGVSYSLAGDDASLTRLRTEYGGFIDQSHNPDALRVALAGISGGAINVTDFSRVAADDEAFVGWVGRMKQRFREPPAALPPLARRQASDALGPSKG
ncbi:MAG: endoglucanase [Caulobacter sp.]|nr:endoglucanase [Caulobacter sp.]